MEKVDLDMRQAEELIGRDHPVASQCAGSLYLAVQATHSQFARPTVDWR
jgi:hypothetical protein